MTTPTPPAAWPYAVLFCSKCCEMCGLTSETKIGGTWLLEPCQLCGQMQFLSEHRTKIPLAQIQEDVR